MINRTSVFKPGNKTGKKPGNERFSGPGFPGFKNRDFPQNREISLK
jgi:hypothetical protein